MTKYTIRDETGERVEEHASDDEAWEAIERSYRSARVENGRYVVWLWRNGESDVGIVEVARRGARVTARAVEPSDDDDVNHVG